MGDHRSILNSWCPKQQQAAWFNACEYPPYTSRLLELDTYDAVWECVWTAINASKSKLAIPKPSSPLPREQQQQQQQPRQPDHHHHHHHSTQRRRAKIFIRKVLNVKKVMEGATRLITDCFTRLLPRTRKRGRQHLYIVNNRFQDAVVKKVM